jgi:hypothetical protein
VTIREWVNDHADALGVELLVMDGYDDCIAGVVERHGAEPCVAYYREKVLAKLMADGMSYEEALEFHEFNQACAYAGKHTPCFIDTLPAFD